MQEEEEKCQLIYNLFINKFKKCNIKFEFITLRDNKLEKEFYMQFKKVLLPNIKYLKKEGILSFWDYDYIDKSFTIIYENNWHIIAGGLDYEKLLGVMLEPFIIKKDRHRFYHFYHQYLFFIFDKNSYKIDNKLYNLLNQAQNIYENKKGLLNSDSQIVLKEFLIYLVMYALINNVNINLDQCIGDDFFLVIEWCELNNLCNNNHLSSLIMDNFDNLIDKIAIIKKTLP